LHGIIVCPTYIQMSYYTSVPIVLYTFYIKFLHEDYYLTKRRALKLNRNIGNHSAVFDVRLDTVLRAPKNNGVYRECNMFVRLKGNPPCQLVLYHRSHRNLHCQYICLISSIGILWTEKPSNRTKGREC
jgi:hypothetical protein